MCYSIDVQGQEHAVEKWCKGILERRMVVTSAHQQSQYQSPPILFELLLLLLLGISYLLI
jgi:hypothetical protein